MQKQKGATSTTKHQQIRSLEHQRKHLVYLLLLKIVHFKRILHPNWILRLSTESGHPKIARQVVGKREIVLILSGRKLMEEMVDAQSMNMWFWNLATRTLFLGLKDVANSKNCLSMTHAPWEIRNQFWNMWRHGETCLLLNNASRCAMERGNANPGNGKSLGSAIGKVIATRTQWTSEQVQTLCLVQWNAEFRKLPNQIG